MIFAVTIYVSRLHVSWVPPCSGNNWSTRFLAGQRVRSVCTGLHAGLWRAGHPQSGPLRWRFYAGVFFGFDGRHAARHADLAARLVAMLGSGVLGIALDRLYFRPLRKRDAPKPVAIISSIGAVHYLVSLAQGAFGAQVSRFPLHAAVAGLHRRPGARPP